MPGAKKFGAYNNRILRVNLTDGKFSEETLSDELVHDYIGGRGFGAKLLYDELRPGIDPLGEENELICLVGPMTGTNSQSFHRWKVTFKSPLTGGYFTSSAGGFFGAEQKAAGFDIIIISGAADKPVYLWVHDGKYQLRDASYLWGLDCDDTHIWSGCSMYGRVLAERTTFSPNVLPMSRCLPGPRRGRCLR
jgi:aldehyde:ferredoxin oxidoreductase